MVLQAFPFQLPISRHLPKIRLNFSSPTILNLQNASFNPEYAVIQENYNRGYVYLIITSNQPEKVPKLEFAVAHPIHLHGHDFVILGQNTTQYDPVQSPKTFIYTNPPRRDVALLPAGGYLVIAFKPDNPGVWLLHCHIGMYTLSIDSSCKGEEGTIG